MSQITMRILGILLLIGGEAISIYSEMIAAQAYSSEATPFAGVFARGAGQIAIAGAMLIAGYMVSYTAFKNIWVVSVISVTSILFVEPGLTYFVFRELPGRGATLGLVLGALGFVATLAG
jgi:hypothetical protein